MNNIVLTGGGTGGHVIPNLCLIPHLKKHFNIYYIGTNSIEKELLQKQKDVIFKTMPTPPKFDRQNLLKNFLIPLKLIKSVCFCKKELKKIKPSVIFSKGGFVSLPVCIAAKLLKIPVISHESDLSIGLANKIIYKLSTSFLTTFEKTSKNLKKAKCVGSPIRDTLFIGSKNKILNLLNLNLNFPTILILGGSTGALTLNESIYKILPEITKHYNIIHVVGKNKGNKNIKHKNYNQFEFLYNIEDFLTLSDLVISRAGSNTICELLALKKPMLLVPLSNNASRGDQIDNAKYFEKLKIALVIEEKNITPENFISKIYELDKKKNSLVNQMNSIKSIYGTQNIVNEILKYK